MPASARELAMELLTRVEQEGAYSNILLNQLLRQSQLDRREAGFATELVYGTIQRRNTIDYFLARFVPKGLHKLDPWVRSLLRLSFYQLYYLDRVPAHAAVNEAVNLAKKHGHAGIAGMVNGVLRNVLRQRETLVLPADLPDVKRIALEHSHPEWMVARWIREYGAEEAEKLCAANNEAPPVSVRANALRQSAGELVLELREAGYEAEPSPLAPAGVRVAGAGNMADSPWYERGALSVQDESSMLVAEALAPEPGMTVLDCCAAPGGKTTHLAEKMQDRGRIVACDVHEHKEALIRRQAERLGLTSIDTQVTDARELAAKYPPASFDRILLDAPCSGLGVIRRKPDLKWAKEESEIASVAKVQQELLEAVHGLLKPGGVLVYSTCTTAREENAGMVKQFLEAHPDFRLEPLPADVFGPDKLPGADSGMVQLLPQQFHSDGFFIARLRKQENG
ncbi:ribosomal RNA small subunit methyltransferase B [Paenibacillus sp. J31TS4]|nr:ribosomal RNA small subunit methyltransferase B [Paenibacillus sp. J31TS4]